MGRSTPHLAITRLPPSHRVFDLRCTAPPPIAIAFGGSCATNTAASWRNLRTLTCPKQRRAAPPMMRQRTPVIRGFLQRELTPGMTVSFSHRRFPPKGKNGHLMTAITVGRFSRMLAITAYLAAVPGLASAQKFEYRDVIKTLEVKLPPPKNPEPKPTETTNSPKPIPAAPTS